jgi:hypothetical protein
MPVGAAIVLPFVANLSIGFGVYRFSFGPSQCSLLVNRLTIFYVYGSRYLGRKEGRCTTRHGPRAVGWEIFYDNSLIY